jgi:hypothetical protein
MRRWLFLLLLFLPLWVLGQTGAKQEAPAQQKSNGTQKSPSASPAQPPAKQEQRQPEHTGCVPPWTDPFWSNWALVLVGIIAAWIAIGTLNDLKEQTAATKTFAEAANRSADAALLNAQAVINSERPWVIIFVKRSSLDVTFAAANLGKTPAEIISYSTVQDFRDSPDSLPVPPRYGTEHVPAVKLLVPCSGKPDGTELDLLKHDPPGTWGKLGFKVGWENQGQACVFYFKIVYRNFISKTANLPNYETRMCFWYTPEQLDPIVGGPQEYNEHT